MHHNKYIWFKKETHYVQRTGKVYKMLFALFFFSLLLNIASFSVDCCTGYVVRVCFSCGIFSIWLFFFYSRLYSCCHFSADALAEKKKTTKPMLLFSHQLNSFIFNSRCSTCDPNRRIFIVQFTLQIVFPSRLNEFGAFYIVVHIFA